MDTWTQGCLGASALGQLCVDLEAASCILDPSLAWVDIDWWHCKDDLLIGEKNIALLPLLSTFFGYFMSIALCYQAFISTLSFAIVVLAFFVSFCMFFHLNTLLYIYM